LINPTVPCFNFQPDSWTDVARLCRRICLLRECGRNDEAEHVRHSALAEAIAARRSAGDSEAMIEQRLDAMFAVEAERVANAAVLAELLAPLLGGRQFHSQDPFTALAGAPEPVARKVPTPPVPLHVAPLEAPAPRADASDISHFIDAMIAQERSPSRDGDVRRAS
jgi:hypothetical protein